MKTTIQLLTAATQELGLPPVSLNNPTGDTMGTQSLAILNALGEELIRIHDWQFLEKVMTFTGDGVTTTFPLPADFKRQVNQTQWAATDKRPMYGPVSAQEWSWTQYGLVSQGIYSRYRILGNEYTVFPVPADQKEFALYYISKNWAIDPNSGNPTDAMLGDNYTCLFDDRLMITGLKVRLWGQKGFDTTQLQNDFNFVLNAEKGQNQGAATINLANFGGTHLLSMCNVPDTGYGGG